MARNLQEHILQTASELFYQQGIKATGIDSIVKAAGTTKMSLYKYFPSKEDLVLAHLARHQALMHDYLFGGVEKRAQQPQQKLLAVFEVFEEFLSSPTFRGCPFINALAEFAEEDHAVQQTTALFYDEFRTQMTQWAQQAGVADAQTLAAQLVMLAAGAVVSEQMRRGSHAMRQAADAAKVLITAQLSPAK